MTTLNQDLQTESEQSSKSPGKHQLYHSTNSTGTLVSWVNLGESDDQRSNNSSSSLSGHGAADQGIVDKQSDEQKMLLNEKTCCKQESTSKYPEFAFIEDRKSGRKILYKRVDSPQDILLECAHLDTHKFEMAILVASNIVIFALGYVISKSSSSL